MAHFSRDWVLGQGVYIENVRQGSGRAYMPRPDEWTNCNSPVAGPCSLVPPCDEHLYWYAFCEGQQKDRRMDLARAFAHHVVANAVRRRQRRLVKGLRKVARKVVFAVTWRVLVKGIRKAAKRVVFIAVWRVTKKWRLCAVQENAAASSV